LTQNNQGITAARSRLTNTNADGKLEVNDSALQEMGARMEAVFSEAVASGVDEKVLQDYAALITNITEAPMLNADGTVSETY
jgi:hypothetical protein